MQALAVERSSPDGPPFFHPGPGANAGALLLRAENSATAERHQASDRTAVSGDDVFHSGLDLADATRERLICFAEADSLAHVATLLNKHPNVIASEARHSRAACSAG